MEAFLLLCALASLYSVAVKAYTEREYRAKASEGAWSEGGTSGAASPSTSGEVDDDAMLDSVSRDELESAAQSLSEGAGSTQIDCRASLSPETSLLISDVEEGVVIAVVDEETIMGDT